MTGPLWQPSAARIAAANLTAFMEKLKEDWGFEGRDYAAVWDFSCREIEKFNLSLWDYAGVIAETRGEVVLADPEKMPGARFFPEAKLNLRGAYFYYTTKDPPCAM